MARPCPPAANPRVVLVIGGAPWHRGKASGAAVADHPRLAFHRRPSYAPSLNPVERSWRGRRRRATHSRPFDPPADLKRPIRNSLCYSQTVPERGRSLVAGCYPAPKATPSPNS